jgi:ATP-dependent Clp protease ATP-binding subunit ClpA
MNQLTKRADQIIRLAKEIARGHGQGHVGTEHLLLAIVREGHGLGARLLMENGATDARLTEEVDRLVQDRLQETWVMGRLPGTPHFKDVLAKAAQETRGRGNWQICSIHLLLALLAERDATACKALANLNITPEMVRRQLAAQVAVG